MMPLLPMRLALTVKFSPDAIRLAAPKYMFTDDFKSSMDMSGALCLTGEFVFDEVDAALLSFC